MEASEPVELLHEHEFFAYVRRGGMIVIEDDANPADRKRVAHLQSERKACSHVDVNHFREKILTNEQTHGRYWWAQNSKVAEVALQASLCTESKRLLGRS